jgi:hypothetical protein
MQFFILRFIFGTVEVTIGDLPRMALTFAILLSGLAQRSSAAIIYVTTLEGIGTGACSLAEAIYASNLQASMAITIPARARCSCSVWEARRSRRRASP